jgi:hypothetical protein
MSSALRKVLACAAVVAVWPGPSPSISAQDEQWRPTRLSNAEVDELSLSAQPEDQSRLCDHFLVVAARHDAAAERHESMARALAGSAGRDTALGPGAHCRRLAARARHSADVARALAAHLDDLAAGEPSLALTGEPSLAPADAMWLDAAGPAPRALVDDLVAGAATADDHLMIAAYFVAAADNHAAVARRHAARAAMARAHLGRRSAANEPALHWERLTQAARRAAADARTQAARHQRLAQDLSR